MRVILQKDYDKMSAWAAEHIISAIKNHKENRPFVLGLPTGSSPIGVYEKLVEAYKAGRVSFKNVITFNMDEYVGLPKTHHESYWYFMHYYFFDHVDVPAENIHILNGNAPDLALECKNYEKMIEDCGGIDLFMGGIGVDGHIAFNEPGSSLKSRTRQMPLTEDTKIVNSRFFDNDPDKVPATALTVGVGTVMDAREVMVVINGHNKANALAKVIEGPVSQACPCSVLQLHENAVVVADEPACGQLKLDTYKYYKDIEKAEIL